MEFRVGGYVSSEVSRTLCIKVAPFVLSLYQKCSLFRSNGDKFIMKFTYTVKIVVSLGLYRLVLDLVIL